MPATRFLTGLLVLWLGSGLLAAEELPLQPEDSPDVIRLTESTPDSAEQQAQEEARRKLAEIEARAAEEKQQVERQLQARLEQLRALRTPQAGLIGRTLVEGKDAKICWLYEHGKILPAEPIRGEFHDGDLMPQVKITFEGQVQLPAEMVVKIWHGAGGVNGDHGTLYLDDRLLGVVGDDTVKNMIYLVKLTSGTHTVRWELTGGYYRENLLKLENPQTGELLPLTHPATQTPQPGERLIKACAPWESWPTATAPGLWRWEIPDWKQ